MPEAAHIDPLHNAALIPIIGRVKLLFEEMDNAYTATAGRYGFQCDGCRENCCETRFYHHTLIEYVYLMAGVAELKREIRNTALLKAETLVKDTLAADLEGKKVRRMCPLNHDQLCLVYPFRPMICRLHGISHELHRGDGKILRGEGCRQFDECARGKPYVCFDRTPFYRAMAFLEKEARRVTGITRKLKMTIAEMLLSERI